MPWRDLAAAFALAAFMALGTSVAAAAEDKPAAEDGAKEGEKGFFGELKDDIVEGAEAVGKDAAAAIPDVPSGAVVAFNRDACPAGWSEFPPAAGRVIRGTGDSGDGKPIHAMQIGDAGTADEGADVPTGVPWVGLLVCEKD